MRARLILGLISLATGISEASAQTTLVYELSANGFGAADVQVVATLADDAYRIDVRGDTFGAADMFGSLQLSAFSTGAVRGDSVIATAFGTDNSYDGEARRTRVSWNGMEAIADEVVPSLADEERTPIPDDARLGALDPISAIFSLSLGGPSQNACSGQVKVFDGRRSYQLSLDAEDDGGVFETVDVGTSGVPALRCRIVSFRTGGKSPDGWFSSSSSSEDATIWFWRTPSGTVVPIRIEAGAFIGSAVATLVSIN